MSRGRFWQDLLCEQGNLFWKELALWLCPLKALRMWRVVPTSLRSVCKRIISWKEALREKLGYKPCARLVARLTRWRSTFESIFFGNDPPPRPVKNGLSSHSLCWIVRHFLAVHGSATTLCDVILGAKFLPQWLSWQHMLLYIGRSCWDKKSMSIQNEQQHRDAEIGPEGAIL